MAMQHKPAVLVLCTGNSCRSQMAEGFLRAYVAHRIDAFSAGLDPKEEVHPLAVQVMGEVGIDIAGQHPKEVKGYLGRLSVAQLIVVCGNAEERCPKMFPGAMNRLYWPFDDPAAAEGTRDEKLAVFRRVRDQIGERVRTWLKAGGVSAKP